jgi:(2Fe-2S) ferredoxin
MPCLQRHVFVCVNERDASSPKGCCFSKGGKAVRDELKKQLAVHKLLGIVRANKSGCLDQCERGVAVVVYPEQVWYQGVKVEDVREIVERHVLKGEYVERLLMDGQDHLANDPVGKALSLPIVDNP